MIYVILFCVFSLVWFLYYNYDLKYIEHIMERTVETFYPPKKNDKDIPL
jgi:hypothetical protein